MGRQTGRRLGVEEGSREEVKEFGKEGEESGKEEGEEVTTFAFSDEIVVFRSLAIALVILNRPPTHTVEVGTGQRGRRAGLLARSYHQN